MAPNSLPTIGILGVTYPASIRIVERLLTISNEQWGEGNNPTICLEIDNLGQYLRPKSAGSTWKKFLGTTLGSLRSRGVEVIISPANSTERALLTESKRLSVPPVILTPSMAVREYIASEKIKEIVLVSTSSTKRNKIYERRLQGVCSVKYPQTQLFRELNECIVEELIFGKISQRAIQIFIRIIEDHRVKMPKTPLVLGCTELYLLQLECPSFLLEGLRIIDSLETLAQMSIKHIRSLR